MTRAEQIAEILLRDLARPAPPDDATPWASQRIRMLEHELEVLRKQNVARLMLAALERALDHGVGR